jgi:hypothetical protein
VRCTVPAPDAARSVARNRRSEQVDHLARIHRAADDLSDRGVQLAPAETSVAFCLIGKPFLQHRHQPLGERQVRRDLVGVIPQLSQRVEG